MRKLLPVLLIWLAAAGAAANEPQLEFWPEADMWLRLSPEWRMSTFIALSKNVETSYREGSLIVQADYAWGNTTLLHSMRMLDENRSRKMKAWLLRGGYLRGQSIDDRGEAYSEQTMLLEVHSRTPLRNGVLLSNRLRVDLRWLGDSSEFSSRLRYRLMAEKEIEAGSASIVPYVNVEPYYDSRYETVNRLRLIGGASLVWSPRWAFEGNITYQHDTRSSVTNLVALNAILHLYFDPRGAP